MGSKSEYNCSIEEKVSSECLEGAGKSAFELADDETGLSRLNMVYWEKKTGLYFLILFLSKLFI